MDKELEFDDRLHEITKYVYLEDKPLTNTDFAWLIYQLRLQVNIKNLQTEIMDDTYQRLNNFYSEINKEKSSLNQELEKDLGELKPLRIGELSGIELIESKFLQFFGKEIC